MVEQRTPPGTGANTTEATAQRQGWMRVLALAATEDVEKAWSGWSPKPEVEAIRGPEQGLVMVTARVDAAGDRFNLGEATVARATVRARGAQMAGEAVGSAYVLGGTEAHAHAAATIDAMLLEGTHRARLTEEVIAPLATALSERDAERDRLARSTQVDFFTVARENA